MSRPFDILAMFIDMEMSTEAISSALKFTPDRKCLSRVITGPTVPDLPSEFSVPLRFTILHTFTPYLSEINIKIVTHLRLYLTPLMVYQQKFLTLLLFPPSLLLAISNIFILKFEKIIEVYLYLISGCQTSSMFCNFLHISVIHY